MQMIVPVRVNLIRGGDVWFEGFWRGKREVGEGES